MPRSDPDGPVVIVDPYCSGALFAPAFAAAGVPVVAVVSSHAPPAVYATSYRPEHFQTILAATEDLEPLVERLRAMRPRCVLPGCESGVELADVLAPLVVPDVANDPEKASARRHKGDMAATVARAGLPILRQICTSDAGEVEAWLRASSLAGRDLVIKPPKSAAATGVTRVPRGEGWREVFHSMLDRLHCLGIVEDRLVVQEYVTGTEYVVDTFSYAGKHTVTDVCRYHKVDSGPYMAVDERMEWLSPKTPGIERLIGYTRGVLDALGIRFGAAHVELILTREGPRLLAIGARPHGGGQPRFCRVATGDSQVDRTVRYFARLGHVREGFGLQSHVLVVFLIPRTAGIVRNAEIFADVEALPSHHFSVVRFRNGDALEPTRALFGGPNLGFVVLAHPERSRVQADYHKIRDMERRLRLDDSRGAS
ncbi:ATP-grasp domain-containing protein [Polyangium sp. 6x1]|uniref:ATP-grasp domain-containing protein n=1 Tax=Polyangium sp. 6x1 TaxID=3042689 RepID=UPI0024821B0C|nr:ATP-grasp domain-containing protein [Polyangium sp. 6x1]MDI1446323.1 ATP-grasp domain-containing protein [Polyangium sp. 6x1]